ncbi:hypothetical protein K1719_020390 [Acacia pycnantha]|nr:hypothetical protein K1719_020390 [Acacia pycnantha]
MDNILLAALLFLIPILIFLKRTKKSSYSSSSTTVPPGSMGIPIIGQSLGLLRAMRANNAEQWIQERVYKYGPISKLNLFGKPTVFMYGPAANKFIFTSNMVTNENSKSTRMILGDRNLLMLKGEEHKRLRGAILPFLKTESLKRYVGKMDEEVKMHLDMYWHGKQEVKVMPLMKTLTFNIISSLLLGVERGKLRDELLECFEPMMEGMWSIPINLPFTRYNRSLKESSKIQKLLKQLVQKKENELIKNQNNTSFEQDLITSLLGMKDEEGKQVMNEKEIIQNIMLLMVAGHDTSAVLMTFLVRLLANEPDIYASLLHEQEEIAESKLPGESLTWEDLTKMKYTWRVAYETLRLFPPVFGNFRMAVRDIEYEGYLIPKGWQIFWVSAMTHMDNNIFPEASNFDPSRFENQSSIPPYSFIAFGGGQRLCPGIEFAKIETLVAIHYLVTRFTWKLSCADNFFKRDPMPVPSQGLPIQISPRKVY